MRAARRPQLQTPSSRSRGRPLQTDTPLGCAAGCELFHNLPELSALAKHLDPMLRSYAVALGRRVSQLIESVGAAGRTGRSSPLNRHRRCVIDPLSELVDGRAARTRTRRISYCTTPTTEMGFGSMPIVANPMSNRNGAWARRTRRE